MTLPNALKNSDSALPTRAKGLFGSYIDLRVYDPTARPARCCRKRIVVILGAPMMFIMSFTISFETRVGGSLSPPKIFGYACLYIGDGLHRLPVLW